MQLRPLLMSRRAFLAATGSAAAAGTTLTAGSRKLKIDLIKAPSNLGLRPSPEGKIPGTDRAADVLIEQGLLKALPVKEVHSLHQLPYSRDPEPGTKLRNGSKIRAFNLELADAVAQSRRSGRFPLVVGGECSNLLGGLLGIRRTGGHGLVHLDGHSDFLQPSFYPPQYPLHSAAGMDLALATGRGEALLTKWPGIEGPLAEDADVFQLGERYSPKPDGKIELFAGTPISQLSIQRLRRIGLAAAAGEIGTMLAVRSIRGAWLHVDTDVLDQSVMPAVDSPGTPGLMFDELAWLIRAIMATGRIGGADVAIYDPDLDPDRKVADQLVKCIAGAFG